MKDTLLEQHKLLFKRWLVSNKNQLECQGCSALLNVQFTLDKTADFFIIQKFGPDTLLPFLP